MDSLPPTLLLLRRSFLAQSNSLFHCVKFNVFVLCGTRLSFSGLMCCILKNMSVSLKINYHALWDLSMFSVSVILRFLQSNRHFIVQMCSYVRYSFSFTVSHEHRDWCTFPCLTLSQCGLPTCCVSLTTLYKINNTARWQKCPPCGACVCSGGFGDTRWDHHWSVLPSIFQHCEMDDPLSLLDTKGYSTFRTALSLW